jgi:hypothetical protein
MPVFVGCPSCGIKFGVADSVLGTRIRCASCGASFEARGPDMATMPPSRSPDESRSGGSGTPRRRDDARPEDRRRWDDDAWDRDDFEGRPPPRRRDLVPHRGSLVLALGAGGLAVEILGVVAACIFIPLAMMLVVGFGLGLTAWIMAHSDLAKIDKGLMDDEGRGSTQSGQTLGIIATALGSVGLVCGLAAFFAWAGASLQ